MNKYFVALLAFTSNALLAGDCCDYECECCFDCDETPCFDAVAYTPQFYDLDCACGIFLTADFLYWYGKESNLPIVQKTKSIIAESGGTIFGDLEAIYLIPQKVEYFRAAWDPGFRVGLGFNSACDGWDLYANWTYYYNTQSRSFSVEPFPTFTTVGQQTVPAALPPPGECGLLSPWSYPGDMIGDFIGDISGGPTFALWDQVKGKYRLQFNNIDLEIGRKFWLSRCTTLRPFAAVRGAWTKTTLKVTSSRFSELDGTPLSFRSDYDSSSRYRNRFWGVGLVLGIQPSWHFSSCFSLYGNADFSLLWGNYEQRHQGTEITDIVSPEDLTQMINLQFSSKSHQDKMQPILDLGLGLRFATSFCCNRFGFSINAGWEHHLWLDHVTRTKLTGGVVAEGNLVTILEQTAYTGFEEEVSNLHLGGLVVRIQLDF